MGLINKTTKKCIFCGSKKNTKYVQAYVILADRYLPDNWYHEECIRKICANPEEYSSLEVDTAIDIIDSIKWTKEREERDKEALKKKCKYLKSHCI